jgi:hypothetical protein
MKDKPFTYFPADTADPCGKYKQPEPNDVDLKCVTPSGQSSGYPQTDVDKDGIMVKGRWPAGTATKTKSQMRGTGAATSGKMFYTDD